MFELGLEVEFVGQVDDIVEEVELVEHNYCLYLKLVRVKDDLFYLEVEEEDVGINYLVYFDNLS